MPWNIRSYISSMPNKAATRVWPDLYNHTLDTVSAHIGHRFKHHNVKADA